MNNQLHDYEKDPHWCYYSDSLYDGIILKYKLIGIPEDYQKYIRCKVYDDSTPVHSNYNGELMTCWNDDPEDIRGISIGLVLNEDHNLNICCRVYASFVSDEPVSNEVCFSQQVNKIKCDRNLVWEEHYKLIPKYFTD